jgi:hypothetical protein
VVSGRLVLCSLRHTERRFVGPRECDGRGLCQWWVVSRRVVSCSLRYSERRCVRLCGGNGGNLHRDRVCADHIEGVAILSIAKLNGANDDKDEEG